MIHLSRIRHVIIRATMILLVLGAPGRASAQTCLAWENQTPPPRSRFLHAMAYDAARSRVVLFGGAISGGKLGDTWEWDGVRWIPIPLATGPSPRSGHAMAYDAARQRTILFGGFTDAGASSETWDWNGASWTLRTSAGPAARFQTAMAYDAVRQRIVLFGGQGTSSVLGDTYEWDGVSWTQRFVGSPGIRFLHALAYDSLHQVTVLFGGSSSAGNNLNDTWTWNGSTWTQIATASPPSARFGHLLFHDPVVPTLIMAGGADPVTESDSYSLTSLQSQWFALGISGLGARKLSGVAWDSGRGRAVIFGGQAGGTAALGDTLEWDGRVTGSPAWTTRAGAGDSPSARYQYGMAFDTVADVGVLFGGFDSAGDSAETWQWDGTTWTRRNVTGPSARRLAMMAYDSGRARTVLFGGFSTVGAENNQTWEWDGTAWTQRTPATSPSARFHGAMVYDANRARTVLFGGHAAGSASAETWEWNGTTWTLRSLAASPPARQGAAMAYDSARHLTVVFGGFSAVNARLADTWEYNGTTWTQRMVAGPSARDDAAMAYDAVRGVTVLSGGFTASPAAVNGEVWQWNGAAWSQVSPGGGGPGARRYHSLMFDAARSQLITFGGDVGGPLGGDTWSLGTVPAVTITNQPSSGAVCIGTARAFIVIASGGSPLTYQWRHDGVDIAGATNLAYNTGPVGPADAGSYDVVVSNACGSVTSAAATLTVNTPPVITTQPTSLAAIIGLTVSRSVVASGAGIAYQWRRGGVAILDGGRISGAASPTITFNPILVADAGQYDVQVTNSCGTVTSSTIQITTGCGADRDHNGLIQPADVSLFVAQWLGSINGGTLAADFDGNGAIQPADVSLFVTAWFGEIGTDCQ